MRELDELLAGLDLVLMRAQGVLAPDELAESAEIGAFLRRRHGFTGDAFVVALCGGTGSGKSSVLNALAGVPVVSVSPVRPHTDRTTAWVPADSSEELEALLDELAIEVRIPQNRLPGVAVLDLPDQDSIEPTHRLAVQRVLPLVDAVAWVFDPEKYADRTIQEDFIGRLAEYQGQFMYVLNKIDTLPPQVVGEVGSALVAELRRIGISPRRYFAVAADPAAGPVLGIDALARHLRERLDAKRVVTGKHVSDVRHAIRLIARQANLERGGAVGYDTRWQEAESSLAASLATSPEGTVLEDALCQLEDFVVGVSVEAGGWFGRRVVSEFPPQWLERQLRAVAEQAAPAQKGDKRSRAEIEPPGEELRRAIGFPLRQLFLDRAILGATLAALDVQAQQLQARLSS